MERLAPQPAEAEDFEAKAEGQLAEVVELFPEKGKEVTKEAQLYADALREQAAESRAEADSLAKEKGMTEFDRGEMSLEELRDYEAKMSYADKLELQANEYAPKKDEPDTETAA